MSFFLNIMVIQKRMSDSDNNSEESFTFLDNEPIDGFYTDDMDTATETESEKEKETRNPKLRRESPGIFETEEESDLNKFLRKHDDLISMASELKEDHRDEAGKPFFDLSEVKEIEDDKVSIGSELLQKPEKEKKNSGNDDEEEIDSDSDLDSESDTEDENEETVGETGEKIPKRMKRDIEKTYDNFLKTTKFYRKLKLGFSKSVNIHQFQVMFTPALLYGKRVISKVTDYVYSKEQYIKKKKESGEWRYNSPILELRVITRGDLIRLSSDFQDFIKGYKHPYMKDPIQGYNIRRIPGSRILIDMEIVKDTLFSTPFSDKLRKGKNDKRSVRELLNVAKKEILVDLEERILMKGNPQEITVQMEIDVPFVHYLDTTLKDEDTNITTGDVFEGQTIKQRKNKDYYTIINTIIHKEKEFIDYVRIISNRLRFEKARRVIRSTSYSRREKIEKLDMEMDSDDDRRMKFFIRSNKTYEKEYNKFSKYPEKINELYTELEDYYNAHFNAIDPQSKLEMTKYKKKFNGKTRREQMVRKQLENLEKTLRVN